MIFFILEPQPRVRSHYRAHKMALWLELIPRLEEYGRNDSYLLNNPMKPNQDTYVPALSTTTAIPTHSSLPATSTRNQLSTSTQLVFKPTTDIYNSQLSLHDDKVKSLYVTITIGISLMFINLIILVIICRQKNKAREERYRDETLSESMQLQSIHNTPSSSRMGTLERKKGCATPTQTQSRLATIERSKTPSQSRMGSLERKRKCATPLQSNPGGTLDRNKICVSASLKVPPPSPNEFDHPDNNKLICPNGPLSLGPSGSLCGLDYDREGLLLENLPPPPPPLPSSGTYNRTMMNEMEV